MKELKRLKRKGPRNVELTLRVFTDISDSELRARALMLCVSHRRGSVEITRGVIADAPDTDMLQVAECRGVHSLGDDEMRARRGAKR